MDVGAVTTMFLNGEQADPEQPIQDGHNRQ
jgi:hypothetical protein